MMALLSLIEPASDLPWWQDSLIGLVILGSIVAAAIAFWEWLHDFRGRW